MNRKQTYRPYSYRPGFQRKYPAVLAAGAIWLLGLQTFAASYEGHGAVTRGALSSPTGYSIYHVTSLADAGPGTLRDAVSQGSRYIVFDVGGVITLQSDLNIYSSYITIDGQTAPPPGITIEQPGSVSTTIYGRSNGRVVHDVIIQHLRMDGLSPGAATGDGDLWGMDGEDGDVYNVILDHITGIASKDGVFDIYGRVYNVTISWNFIKDSLVALHLSHEETVKENISIHHNVFAHNNERQIRLKYDSRVDYVNNVVYGWGWYEGGGKGLNIDTTYSVDPTINVVNNYFHHVSGTDGRPNDAIVYGGGTGTAKVYMSGNIVPVGELDTAGTVTSPNPVPLAARVTTYPASALGNQVVPCVGMGYPTVDEDTLLRQIALAIGGSGNGCPNVATPEIASLEVENGSAVLNWPTVINRTYRVQYKESLNDPAWHDLPGTVLATQLDAAKSDGTAANRRFYRVVELPR